MYYPLSVRFRGCLIRVKHSFTRIGTTAFRNFLTLSRFSVALRGLEILNAVHKLIELEVLEFYARKTREVWFSPVGRFKSFDGISQSKNYSVEVKFEAQAAKTQNLCIEYSYRGQPSGIAVTQAAKWVHVVPVDHERLCCFEFDVERLKEALKGFPFLAGGDDMRSRFRLLPISRAEELKNAKFDLRIDWKNIKPYW